MTPLLVVAFLGVTDRAIAAFETWPASPRAAAMGGAAGAVTGDAVSLFHNPAALTALRHLEFDASYLRQFHLPSGETNRDQFNLAAGVPVSQEIIGGVLGFGYGYGSVQGRGAERALVFSYATRGLREGERSVLDLGGSLKFLSVTGSAGKTIKPALDFGALWRLKDRYGVAAAVENLNGPSMPGGDRAAAGIRLGVSESLRGFTMAADIAKREPSGGHPGTAEVAAGLERWWATSRWGSAALRTGLALGDRNKTWNWGLGWRLQGAQIDYAMTVPISGVTRFGHAVALMMRFGEANPEGEYEKILRQEVGLRKDLATALEAGHARQWKLAEELRRQREEIETLRKRLLDRTASEAEARERLKSLENRHRRAVDAYEREKKEQQRLAERTQETLLREDWAAYQKLKLGGAPDAVLLDQLQRLLRQYKDSGLDLSEAHQEYHRLLRSR